MRPAFLESIINPLFKYPFVLSLSNSELPRLRPAYAWASSAAGNTHINKGRLYKVRWLHRFCPAAVCASLVIGCAGAPPAPEPLPATRVLLQIEAAGNINPDSTGKPSPVLFRIYRLREQSGFKGADFFALFSHDKATLAGELVGKQEFLLKPGETKPLTLQPEEEAGFIGLLAGFRQLDNAQWRAVVLVKPHQDTPVAVKLENNQLSVGLPPEK